MTNLIFDYYKEAARILGAKPESEDSENAQAAYSLYWFFCENKVEQLNSLTQCFFKEAEGWEKLRFHEKVPEHLEKYYIEGMTPNKSQAEAIAMALTNPISFIQGPPGTGKTATILNLVSCIIGLHGTVAVVSGNNSAIQNVEEKVDGYELKYPNQRRMKEGLARLGSAEKRKVFNREQEYTIDFKAKKTFCGAIEISREGTIRAEDFTRKYPFITSTIHSLKKCFADGAFYQYDYVIVDESSQVDLIAGIVAMSAAKHLVLIGDDNQLPPVVDTVRISSIQVETFAIERYIIEENKSFLTLCSDIFKECDVSVLLNEHYRCHPGIIDFCNKEVYKNELVIKTSNYDLSSKVPIRVWWFEGNYCEKCYYDSELRKSKRNRKQVKIFIEKEWKPLTERLVGEDPPSVCILTPFRGQLKELNEAITQYNQENGIQLIVEFQGKELEAEKVAKDAEEDAIPMLTVHKSQGREFDLVYFLPVEDGDWEYPWSQHKRLVNVAVSRAKKELCVIASAQLMPKELQCKLTKKKYLAPSTGKNQNEDVKEEDQRFVQRLLNYVYSASEDEFPESNTKYGFHNAGMHSIFDQKPWILQERKEKEAYERGTEDKVTVKQYSTEMIVRKELLNMQEFKDYSLRLFQDVLMKDLSRSRTANTDLERLSKEDWEYYWNGAQIDFLICENGKVIAAIEVDGERHRFCDEEQKARDRKKDHIFATYFKDIPFIRLADDGKTTGESEVLRKAIEAGREAPLYRYFARGISKIVEKYNESREEEEVDLDCTQLRSLLQESNLLFEDYDEEMNTKVLRPTKKGRFEGIVRGYGITEDGKREYEVPYYTQRATKEIMKIIEEQMK